MFRLGNKLAIAHDPYITLSVTPLAETRNF